MVQYGSLCYIWLLFVVGFVCTAVVCCLLWCVLCTVCPAVVCCLFLVVVCTVYSMSCCCLLSVVVCTVYSMSCCCLLSVLCCGVYCVQYVLLLSVVYFMSWCVLCTVCPAVVCCLFNVVVCGDGFCINRNICRGLVIYKSGKVKCISSVFYKQWMLTCIYLQRIAHEIAIIVSFHSQISYMFRLSLAMFRGRRQYSGSVLWGLRVITVIIIGRGQLSSRGGGVRRFVCGEGPRSSCYGRIAALRLFVQPCDEDNEFFFFVSPCNGAPVEWNWEGKPEALGEKPVPVPLCPPQIPHGLTRHRTRASEVKGWRLTAWTIARPCPTGYLRVHHCVAHVLVFLSNIFMSFCDQ
jgi:hypothetical protein